MSVREIQEVLSNVGEQHERPLGWISRRRWLFHGTGKVGAKQNADGLDEKAFKIMEDNLRISNRQMVHVLPDKGISRSREWVRKNRVSGN